MKEFFKTLWELVCELLYWWGQRMEEHHQWRLEFIQEHGYDPCPEDHFRDLW